MDVNIIERRQHALATVEVCRSTVTTLLNDRQTFRHFADAVNASFTVRQTWFPTIVARWYTQSTLVALRRLCDRNSRADSLFVLMEGMIAAPRAWSFDSVFELWRIDDGFHYPDEQLRWLLQSTYNDWSDATGRQLNSERIKSDQKQLNAELRHVRTVVNKQIAHAERAWEPPKLTFNDLDRAIDTVHELVKPYIALITGAGYSDMTPTDQVTWWRIFDPWKTLEPFKQ